MCERRAGGRGYGRKRWSKRLSGVRLDPSQGDTIPLTITLVVTLPVRYTVRQQAGVGSRQASVKASMKHFAALLTQRCQSCAASIPAESHISKAMKSSDFAANAQVVSRLLQLTCTTSYSPSQIVLLF